MQLLLLALANLLPDTWAEKGNMRTYTYDEVGNGTKMAETEDGEVEEEITYTYDPANQILSSASSEGEM